MNLINHEQQISTVTQLLCYDCVAFFFVYFTNESRCTVSRERCLDNGGLLHLEKIISKTNRKTVFSRILVFSREKKSSARLSVQFLQQHKDLQRY